MTVEEFKTQLAVGYVIYIGYNCSYAGSHISFEDNSYYSNTDYGAYFTDGVYYIMCEHCSNDGCVADCDDAYQFDSFDELIRFIRSMDLSDVQINF